MTSPADEAVPRSAPLSPERWRQVDAILRAALPCELDQREAFVREACGDDANLCREVLSLLAAHDDVSADFLEAPAASALGLPKPLHERLAAALADRYALEGEIAQGGMSTVYLARDLRHDRAVAIKVLREDLAAAVGGVRFLEEIRVTASLHHPNILPLFDSGNADGVLWYAMPLIEGETLRTRLSREGRLPLDVALPLAREIADALEHAHRHGIVHRDVKPENVLLQDGHALVADFGVALALEHAGGERLTRTGIRIGTPQYMSPEQVSGHRDVDARADVYALGAVVREMVTGESPLSARPGALLVRMKDDVDPRGGHRVAMLDAAIRKALSKDPADRFATAGAFAAALPSGMDADTGALSSGTPDRVARGRQVSARGAMYVAGLTLLVGLVGGWVLARSDWLASITGSGSSPSTASTDAGPDEWAAAENGLSLAVVDRSGREVRAIPANRPWTPRFSPDGRRVAYGAFGSGRNTSDLWILDFEAGTTRRITDDDRDANDPQWSADGQRVVYSVSAPGGKDLHEVELGSGAVRVLAARAGTQFASDWMRDGRALLVTEQTRAARHDVIVQPVDGSAARPYAATSADEMAARVSPDGRWVAYQSDETGRSEVYLDSHPTPSKRVLVSSGGGVHPTWRGDGKELYYWGNGALTAVSLRPAGGDNPPGIGNRTVLFRASYEVGLNTMYDVSPDGERFVIVRHR
jgi:serine/threonine-protein kinase